MADTNVGSISYDVKIDTSGMNKATTAVKDFAKVTAVALTAVAAGTIAFGVSSFNAYKDAEKANAQLRRAVVDVTGATEEQLKATENLADALEKKGVLDGDNIKTGLAQLSTFGLSNKAVQGLAGSLSDLAVNQYGVSATGEQLTDSANMIAKALRGEFGMLAKSGIRFTEAQIATINYGTEMEKVAAINEGFAQNLKYTNETAKETSEGGLARLKVGIENIQESIGGAIANGINPLVQKLSEFVQSDQFQKWVSDLTAWLSVNLPIAFNFVINDLIPSLQKAFIIAQPYIQTAWDTFKALADFLMTPFGQAVGVAVASLGILSTAFGSVVGLIASPIIMPAIVVAAALGAIASVMTAYNNMQSAIEGAKKAEANLRDIELKNLEAQYRVLNNPNESDARKSNARNIISRIKSSSGKLSGGWATGGFTGVGGVNEIAGIVHRGEYVLPQNMVNQSTGLPKSDNKSFNSTFNINMTGVMTSSPSDERTIAKRLVERINEELRAKGMTQIGVA